VEAVVLPWVGAASGSATDSTLAGAVTEALSAGIDVGVLTAGDALDLVRCLGTGARWPGTLFVGDEHQVLRAGDGAPAVVSRTGRPDPPDAVEEILAALWRAGVGPELALVARPRGAPPPVGPDGRPAGVAHVAEGPPARRLNDLRDILAEQVRFREARCLPEVDRDPRWLLELEVADGHLQRVHASLLALSNGTVGTSGEVEWQREASSRLLLCNGAYGEGDDGLVRPLPGPTWAPLALGDWPTGSSRAVLDMRTGVLRRELPGAPDGRGMVRFVSLARPAVMALRAAGIGSAGDGGPLAEPMTGDGHAAHYDYHGTRAEGRWAAGTASDRSAIAAVAHQDTLGDGDGGVGVDRIAAVRAAPSTAQDATGELDRAVETGFDGLLREHRAAWARRWADAEIVIDGDPEAELAARFALFHLLASAPTAGESAIGARGLTGLAYAGHVFWDTDVFVLPALAATLPAAARAVLEYRVRRLPAARAAAAGTGHDGARFPWESADTGEDVTPPSVQDFEGRLMPIRTAQLEEHITADIAWAALHYLDWTGDAALLTGAGQGLVVDTAQYWASRAVVDPEGRAHIKGVMGPDEYHEDVDDNAFTNLMVRWHLRRAAALVDPAVAARWRALAAALVDGHDPDSNRHEQFSGFSLLEPLMIGEMAPVPVAADILLGHERLGRTQVIKQPDVLMAHHLIPDELPAGSLAADLDFYLPRTAHGSSLSPAICASLLARTGRPDDAMGLFDIAARLDLDDLTGTTAGGLHLATMGGLWQAIVHGFAGIRPEASHLTIDPSLPDRWDRLQLRLVYHGTPLTVRIDHDHIAVDAPRSLPLRIQGQRAGTPARFARATNGWRRTS
jgi:hypothetical protein